MKQFKQTYVMYLFRMKGDFESYDDEPWSPVKTVIQCCSTWIISFIINFPIIYGAKWFNFDWGNFGPNPMMATCASYVCQKSDHSRDLMYNITFMTLCDSFFNMWNLNPRLYPDPEPKCGP